jgi:hypothetical protein
MNATIPFLAASGILRAVIVTGVLDLLVTPFEGAATKPVSRELDQVSFDVRVP